MYDKREYITKRKSFVLEIFELCKIKSIIGIQKMRDDDSIVSISESCNKEDMNIISSVFYRNPVFIIDIFLCLKSLYAQLRSKILDKP